MVGVASRPNQAAHLPDVSYLGFLFREEHGATALIAAIIELRLAFFVYDWAFLAAEPDGDHRLRHVGFAPLFKRGAPLRRDGAADERGAEKGPRPWCVGHSCPE